MGFPEIVDARSYKNILRTEMIFSQSPQLCNNSPRAVLVNNLMRTENTKVQKLIKLVREKQ